jgi:hypothetical protein
MNPPTGADDPPELLAMHGVALRPYRNGNDQGLPQRSLQQLVALSYAKCNAGYTLLILLLPERKDLASKQQH